MLRWISDVPPPMTAKPRVAEEPLHRIFHAIAVAAHNLQPQIGNQLCTPPGIQLQHRGIVAGRPALRSSARRTDTPACWETSSITFMSASLCEIAWNWPMGFPNCLRFFA